MSRDVRFLALAAFRAARMRGAGPVVGFTFANASRFLPVERLYETDEIVAFRHPRPVSPGHTLIVPKRRIAGVEALPDGDGRLLLQVLDAAHHVARATGIGAYSLSVNGGAYQDIRQLHFHLVPRSPSAGR